MWVASNYEYDLNQFEIEYLTRTFELFLTKVINRNNVIWNIPDNESFDIKDIINLEIPNEQMKISFLSVLNGTNVLNKLKINVEIVNRKLQKTM